MTGDSSLCNVDSAAHNCTGGAPHGVCAGERASERRLHPPHPRRAFKPRLLHTRRPSRPRWRVPADTSDECTASSSAALPGGAPPPSASASLASTATAAATTTVGRARAAFLGAAFGGSGRSTGEEAGLPLMRQPRNTLSSQASRCAGSWLLKFRAQSCFGGGDMSAYGWPQPTLCAAHPTGGTCGLWPARTTCTPLATCPARSSDVGVDGVDKPPTKPHSHAGSSGGGADPDAPPPPRPVAPSRLPSAPGALLAPPTALPAADGASAGAGLRFPRPMRLTLPDGAAAAGSGGGAAPAGGAGGGVRASLTSPMLMASPQVTDAMEPHPFRCA